MRYYLDCEFNGYRGALISLALVREDGRELYMVDRSFWDRPRPANIDPWVDRNVMPFIANEPVKVETPIGMATEIERFLIGDPGPVIVADWPDDIRYFCETIITGPGEMVDVAGLVFEVVRVDAYPTDLPGAVQHNALWDARALRRKLTGQ